jgi:hypothetical protein
VIIGSIVNLVNSSKENLYSASLLVVVSLILASLAWFGRRFALKGSGQGHSRRRKFRHFILTEGPWIIACAWDRSLRYASHRMRSLLVCASRPADKNLKGVDIKKAIQNWRADHHRA